jgi:hypothetical protein
MAKRMNASLKAQDSGNILDGGVNEVSRDARRCGRASVDSVGNPQARNGNVHSFEHEPRPVFL